MKKIDVRTIIIMVAIVVIGAIVASFMGLTYRPTAVTADVNARIYAPKQNIGVLNEEGIFSINVRNNGNLTTIRLMIIADDRVVDNETMIMEAESSKSTTIAEALDSLGEWRIRVLDEDNRSVSSYSFLVVLNKGEADVRINQWNDIQYNKLIATAGIFVSIIGLAVSAVSAYISVLALRTARKHL